MFARLTIVQVKVDKIDEVIKIYGDNVVPAAKSQKGYKGILMLTDRKTGKGGESPRKRRSDVFSIQEIMELFPHRYPFLLVDRIVEWEPEKRIVGIKNVTINEPFFQGHFPGLPVMPGVLIVEAMAQAGGLLAMHLLGEGVGERQIFFMTIDSARFRRPVVPGDQVRFEVRVERRRATVWRCFGQAFVDGTLVADAELQAMIGPAGPAR